MDSIPLKSLSVNIEQPELGLAWNVNSSVQKLLDVVVHILANEYIRTAKENPTLFSNIESPK